MNSAIENETEENHSEQSTDEDEEELDESDVHLCHWCHRIEGDEENFSIIELSDDESDREYYYCSQEHEQRISRFYDYSKKIGVIYFSFIILIPLVLLILLVIFKNWLFVYILFISLGIGIVIYPRLGEKTVIGIGLKNSLFLGRVLGAILIIIGLTLFIINGWTVFRPN